MSLLPLSDGSNQIVRGLTLPEVTVDMPDIQMGKVFSAIKKKHKDTKMIQNLKVPKVVSGKVDMIIGLRYANVFPKLIHQFPNGLAVYESKLMPATPGATTCLVRRSEKHFFQHLNKASLDSRAAQVAI